MNDSGKNVLEALRQMEPLEASTHDTPFEIRCGWVANRLLALSSIAFIFLVSLLLWVKFSGPATGAMKCFGMRVAVMCEALALIALVVYCLPAIPMIFCFRRKAGVRMNCEFQHDHAHAEILARFERSALKGADAYLRIYVERTTSFINSFVGSGEKVALFSFVALAWNAFKEFHGPEAQPFNVYIQFGLAFLGGIALASLMMSVVLRRYVYFRSLIELALFIKGSDELVSPA